MVLKFAKRLRELRMQYDLGQAQVARMANVTKNAISTYENGTLNGTLNGALKYMATAIIQNAFLMF